MTGNCYATPTLTAFKFNTEKVDENIQIPFETRVVSTRQHLRTNEKQNKYTNKVVIHEKDKLMRVGKELLMVSSITDDPQLKPRNIR